MKNNTCAGIFDFVGFLPSEQVGDFSMQLYVFWKSEETHHKQCKYYRCLRKVYKDRYRKSAFENL
jgi:hypothetical protein